MAHHQPDTASSPVAICTDSARARELYKYFQPPHISRHNLATSRPANPDTVLTALAQLVAWRLDARRSLISLIDRGTQYYVAETSKTLDLANDNDPERLSDSVWAGCSSVPKRGRLCEKTLEQPPGPDGLPTCFEVLDLTKDDRFASLPFVVAEPHFRYYVGVPLKTKKCIPIGSLCAMDVRVRDPLDSSGRKFLATMASNVIEHLELMKEKEDRKRAVNMNMCLAAFVDPVHPLRERKRTPNLQRVQSFKRATFAQQKAARCTHREDSSDSIVIPKLPGTPQSTRCSDHHRQASRNRNAATPDSSDNSEAESSSRIGDDDHLETFERASQGLLDSLSLKSSGGGVVFMSTTAGLRPDGTRMPSVKPSMEDAPERALERRGSVAGLTEHSMDNAPTYTDSGHFVEVLAHASAPTADEQHQDHSQQSFMLLLPDDLARLIRRHPRGKLFSLGDDDGFSLGGSSEDESLATEHSAESPIAKRRFIPRSEAFVLTRHFPRARQIIFVPLWDVQTESWVACFAYNTSEFRTFCHNPDFLHSIAFCCCIMTEVARLATLASDQQKSDFIGSISHELRSPLHGILASCEFLADTECSSYQSSLLSTADSCARTLLDTINMVLDYSKINSFERNIRKARKVRKEVSMQQPSLNIYDAIDLAAVTEEVVAGVTLGHVFRDITNFDASDDRDQPAPNRNLGTLNEESSTDVKRPAVETIIDIQARRWDFVTQPGAFRRIVMNLFGNAIKYTKQGFIHVGLKAKDIKEPASQRPNGTQDYPATSIVTLTVSDSGQGISPEYLRTKLFKPFAQENPLNPGTGLGLSLVRSLADALNGEISIRSALDVGTEVVVTLPMVKGGNSTTNLTTTPASIPTSCAGIGSICGTRASNASLSSVRLNACGMTAAIFRPPDYERLNNPLTARALDVSKQAFEYLFKAWYGFSNVVDWTSDLKPDLITVDEVDLSYLLSLCPSLRSSLPNGPMLLLVRAGTGKSSATECMMKHANLEYLYRPVGPYKLARALQNVMERRARQCNPSRVADSVISTETADDETAGDMVTHIQQIKLSMGGHGAQGTLNVLHQGETLGNDESINAHMAMDTLPSPDSLPVEKNGQFSFPGSLSEDESRLDPSCIPPECQAPFGDMSWTAHRRRHDEESPEPPMGAPGPILSSAMPDERRLSSAAPAACTARRTSHDAFDNILPTRQKSTSSRRSSKTPSIAPARSPRLLLVDDNAVNLRLLQTFMRKRAYTTVHSAADGAQAVSLFESLLFGARSSTDIHAGEDVGVNYTYHNRNHHHLRRSAPPDIIFMDISMPVMNGFEATRRIRALEADFSAARAPHERLPPSLIVALTGLASGRDQSEAFTSGFDLYMTKPVSFKEVGRLLDNWVANGGIEPGMDTGGCGMDGDGEGVR